MNIVTFPIFGWKFYINKVAFRILGIDIYWYAILITLSLVIAILACKKQDGKYGIKYHDILDLAILVIPISLIGARLYYVIFNLNYYSHNMSQILNIRSGGMAIYGGLIAGAITIYFFCKKRNILILDLFDYIIPYIALGQSIGRWGNFINGEAYGIATDLPWKMGIYKEDIVEYVHPTFLYESISTFFLFLLLLKIGKNRKFKGELTCIYLIVYSFVRIWIEGLRIDSLMLYKFRISQILSILLFVIFCIIWVYNVVKAKKTK